MEIKLIATSLFKNNQGSTELLMSIIVLTVILAAVLTTSEILSNGLVADKIQLNSTKAYFTAEAATERILWHVRKQGDDLSSCSDRYIDFTPPNSEPSITSCNGSCAFTNYIGTLLSYKYCIKYGATAETKLTSYGDYQGARRAVEIIY